MSKGYIKDRTRIKQPKLNLVTVGRDSIFPCVRVCVCVCVCMRVSRGEAQSQWDSNRLLPTSTPIPKKNYHHDAVLASTHYLSQMPFRCGAVLPPLRLFMYSVASLYMHACIHIFTCTFMYYIYIYTYIYLYIYTCMCTYPHMYMHTHVHTNIYIYVCVCIYIYTVYIYTVQKSRRCC